MRQLPVLHVYFLEGLDVLAHKADGHSQQALDAALAQLPAGAGKGKAGLCARRRLRYGTGRLLDDRPLAQPHLRRRGGQVLLVV